MPPRPMTSLVRLPRGDTSPQRAVLQRVLLAALAEVHEAARVLVAAQRDDTAVLVTLTVRQLNATASVVVAVREAENAPLLLQSGANSVIVSSEAAGRLLGMAATSPATGEVFEDLLIPHKDLEMAERDVLTQEVGQPARSSQDLVLAVLRAGQVHRFGTPEADVLRAGDRVVVVRSAESVQQPGPGLPSEA